LINHSMVIRNVALFTALSAGLLVAHADALAALVRTWRDSAMYSYGFLIPAISLYLVWRRRELLAQLAVRPARLEGLLLLGFGISMLMVGRLGSMQIVQQLAFPFAIAGTVLFVLGRSHLRVTWPAIAYLLLMIPIWELFTEPLHWPLQNQSAHLAIHVLWAVGVPAYREGTFILLPNVALEVARNCSGVNYLIAVVALGIPLSYAYLKGIWRRAVVVGAALGVAVVSNGLRVALIGILAYHEFEWGLHGPSHVLHGLFVSAAGFAVLAFGIRLLRTAPPVADAENGAGHRLGGVDGSQLRVPVREAVATALVFWLMAIAASVYQPRSVPLQVALEDLPMRLGEWVGVPLVSNGDLSLLDGGESPWGGADAELRRRYLRDGREVGLYIGYFGYQRQEREVVNHRTRVLHRSASEVVIPAGQGVMRVNHVRADETMPMALFWYDVDGAVETTELGVKLRTVRHAVWRGRTNGAIVLLYGRTDGDSGTEEESVAALSELAVLVHEALAGRLPGHGAAARDSEPIPTTFQSREVSQDP
jgi:EpsI family protein